jgi:hypothetical protein
VTRILKINKCLDCPNSQHSIDYVGENGELTGGETVGGWCWFGEGDESDEFTPPTLTQDNMLECPPDWCGLPLAGAE